MLSLKHSLVCSRWFLLFGNDISTASIVESYQSLKDARSDLGYKGLEIGKGGVVSVTIGGGKDA